MEQWWVNIYVSTKCDTNGGQNQYHRFKLICRLFRLNCSGAAFSVRIVTSSSEIPPFLINASSGASFTSTEDYNSDKVASLFASIESVFTLY